MRKTYLITGASSGIGEEFARQLAARGCDLILLARRMDRLSLIKAELEAKHSISVECVGVDLSNRNEVVDFCEKLKSFRIDGLINNAGFSVAPMLLRSNFQKQLEFIETCVVAPTILLRAVLEGMAARKSGYIINVSSMVAFSNGAKGHTLYPAAKAYVLKMSRSIAAEVKELGIKVTALCPGATKSEFQIQNGMMEKTGKENFMAPMETSKVVEMALLANEKGKEVVVTGWVNKIAVFLMTKMPDFLITPLIRNGAEKFLIE